MRTATYALPPVRLNTDARAAEPAYAFVLPQRRTNGAVWTLAVLCGAAATSEHARHSICLLCCVLLKHAYAAYRGRCGSCTCARVPSLPLRRAYLALTPYVPHTPADTFLTGYCPTHYSPTPYTFPTVLTCRVPLRCHSVSPPPTLTTCLFPLHTTHRLTGVLPTYLLRTALLLLLWHALGWRAARLPTPYLHNMPYMLPSFSLPPPATFQASPFCLPIPFCLWPTAPLPHTGPTQTPAHPFPTPAHLATHYRTCPVPAAPPSLLLPSQVPAVVPRTCRFCLRAPPPTPPPPPPHLPPPLLPFRFHNLPVTARACSMPAATRCGLFSARCALPPPPAAWCSVLSPAGSPRAAVHCNTIPACIASRRRAGAPRPAHAAACAPPRHCATSVCRRLRVALSTAGLPPPLYRARMPARHTGAAAHAAAHQRAAWRTASLGTWCTRKTTTLPPAILPLRHLRALIHRFVPGGTPRIASRHRTYAARYPVGICFDSPFGISLRCEHFFAVDRRV